MVGQVTVRRASKADAGDIAILINIATHGLFADLSGKEEGAGAVYGPLETGRRRVLGEGELSWRHANLAEQDGETAGLLLGFSEPDVKQVAAGTDSYAELVAETRGGWHISKVAVHTHCRGRGVASRLLHAADERGQEAGERRLFLIAPDSFADALRLYERHGFRERGRRPLVMPPGTKVDLGAKDWVLMVKE